MEEEKQVVNEAPKKSDEGFLKRYDTVFAFLGLEVIALMLFGLGGATGQTIVKVLSVALGLLAYPFVKAEYGKETIKKNAIRLIPLWVFFLVIGFSAFWVDVYSSTFSAIVLNLMEALGLFGMFLLGFTLKCIKALKRDIILLVILGSLALYVLVVGIYAFARYGFFYQSLYAGRVYYYDGVLFPIDSETKILNGFAFMEASSHFGLLPAFLLASSGVGLFAIHPKKDTKRFLILLGFAFIGLAVLAFTPALFPLILLAIVYLFAFVVFLFIKFSGKGKMDLIGKILFLTLVGLCALGVFMLFLEAAAGVLSKMVPALSGRLSAGKLGEVVDSIRRTMFNSPDPLASFNLKTFLFGYSRGAFSSVFEFNILSENGIVAFGLLIYLFIFFAYSLHRFLKDDKEDFGGKLVLFALILAYVAYLSFFADELPLRHQSQDVSLFTTRGHLFFALFFLLGLTYQPKEKALNVTPAEGAEHE